MLDKFDQLEAVIKQLNAKLPIPSETLRFMFSKITSGITHKDASQRQVATNTMDGLSELVKQNTLTNEELTETIQAYDQILTANLDMVHAKKALTNYEAATPGFHSNLLLIMNSNP